MKITIELSDVQVRGIKKYLKEVDLIFFPNKEDIKREINGIVHSNLQAPQSSLTDYIRQEEYKKHMKQEGYK